MTPAKTPVMDLQTDEDGWIGGASQSIYARKPDSSTHASPPQAPKAPNKPSPKTPAREKTTSSPSSGGSKATSLLERMDMAQNLQTPPPKSRNGNSEPRGVASTPSPTENPSTSPFRTTPSQGIRRPGAKIPSPLPLTSPARNNAPVSPLNTRTPLSASHPIPETPLKLSMRGGPQTPATPHYPSYPHASHHNQDGDAARASGLGLGLTPLKTPIPLAPSPDSVRSPLNDALNLRGRAASNASIGSPLKQGRSDLHGEPLALDSSSNTKNSGGAAGNGQIDAMLDRLRNTRSGLGTSASMWAPKPSNDGATSSTTTSHTIGSGFSSGNLLGVQTGLDRKRPSHRPNGLQLSLGQEISVMQELDEKAEEDYASSNISSAAVGDNFRIEPPDNQVDHADQDGWQGTVVPPTPSLGCDSPSSDEETAAGSKVPSRGLDAFGWGAPSNSAAGKSSLFSKLPSSSTLEANWSGDDDDDKKDDMEVFEDMQRAAKASKQDKRNSTYAPLPPPPINYANSRTPSPTHRMLAKSPQLDGLGDKNNSFGSPMFDTAAAGADKGSKQRLSPASARSQLPSGDDSDGDADVENDRPRAGGKERKASKKHEVDATKQPQDSLQVDAPARGLEKKRSLKRDKSERIRGRRASQSKEKDIKITSPSSQASANGATVSLPTASFSKKEDELAKAVDKVSLADTADKPTKETPVVASAVPAQLNPLQPSQSTPVAQRVQSIPTVKDDLFSSSAEPKVELPSSHPSAGQEAKVVSTDEAESEQKSAEKPKQEESKREAEEAVVPKTPEPAPAKTMSFDWAADDDELDDELPDLDDWGVTLTPIKPAPAPEVKSVPAPAGAVAGGKESARHGKKADEGSGAWRRGGMLDAPSSAHGGRGGAGGGGKGKQDKPKGASIKGSAAAAAATGGAKAGGDLGIRIAGRAKTASLSPEPEIAPATQRGKNSVAPPASTPYGRWNKTSSSTPADEGVTFKGSGSRKALAAAGSRPKVASENLGSLARLLSADDAAMKGLGKKGGERREREDRSRKSSPVVERGEEFAKKPAPAAAGSAVVGEGAAPSVKDSIHAPPSVGDSMHAPKNSTPNSGSGTGGPIPTGPKADRLKKKAPFSGRK